MINSKYAKAYHKGITLKDNVIPHINKELILKLDIINKNINFVICNSGKVFLPGLCYSKVMEDIMSIKRLLDYIEQNIKEEITLVDLAEIVHYSPRQIYYMIKEETGMPVMSYIRYKRLQKAADEIAHGRKLFDVAVEYGFETQAGFYKAFLLQIGCSPKEYQYHELLHYAHKNYPSIELISKEENIMDDIKIRKVEQKDTRSVWENIFSRNTPEEVEQRIAESIAEMEAGRRIHLVAVIEDNVIGNIILLKE